MEVRDGTGLCRLLFAMMAMAIFLCGSASATGPDSETCLECHDTYQESLVGGSHNVGLTNNETDGGVTCSSCHSGGATHIEDPSTDNIGNPGHRVGADAINVCVECHQPHAETGIAGLDQHAGQDLVCADCHAVHTSSGRLASDAVADMCDGCHGSIVSEFEKRSNHPLADGIVSCISCHGLTSSLETALGHGGSANCYSCHPEQSGPYVYEHEAASSFTPEGGGCISCHSPHGSANERLLNQPARQLCMQCHGEPPLHRVAHTALATGFDCIDCHSDIHGSYDNSHLLDPQLGSKVGDGAGSCFCHSVED